MVKFDNQAKVDEAYRKSPREVKATYVIKHRINHNSTGELRFVHEKGHHIRDAGERIVDAKGMIHDITGQKAADEQIRSIAKLLRENPNPVLRVDRRGVILYANDSCRRLGGDHLAEVGFTLPPEWLALAEKAFAAGEKVEADVPEGGKVWLVTAAPIPDEGYANLYAVDITERRKKETETDLLNYTLQSISNCNQAMMRACNESDILREACRIIVEDCGYAMVWIGIAESDEDKTVRPAASAGFEEGYLAKANITWADSERGRGPTGTAIRTGRPFICRNILTDPSFEPWRTEAIKRGYASSITLPIHVGDRVFGTLMIYSREADPFSDKEVALLSELTSDLGYGIQAIRLRASRDGLLKQVEEQRSLSQHLADELSAIIASIPEPVIVCDAEARVQRANQAAAKLIGYDPAGLHLAEIIPQLSMRHLDGSLIDPADSPTVRALTGSPLSGDHYRITSAVGCEATIMVSASPLREGDAITGAVTVLSDITDQERMLAEIQRKAAELNAVITSIVDGVIIHDKKANIIRMNPVAEKIVGYLPEEQALPLADRLTNAVEFFSADGQPITNPEEMPVPRALRGETVSGTVIGLRQRRTGKFFWLAISSAPLRMPDGTVFGAVSTQTDITQRIETEKELARIRDELESQVRDRTLELEAANSYNRNLIEAIVDPMVTIALDGKIGDVNTAAEAVTGFARGDIIGKDFSSFFTDKEKARAGYRRVFDEGSVCDYELEIRHRDGHLTPVLLNASVYLEGTRGAKAVIATARDITQHKQGEAQVKRNTRRVEIMAEISRLLADAEPNYQPVLKNIAEETVRLFGGECRIHSPSMDGRLHIAVRHPATAGNSISCTSDSADFIERLVNWSYQSQKQLFLPAVTEEEIRRSGYAEEIPTPEGAPLSSLIVIPLLFQSNPLGVLTIAQHAPDSHYTTADLTLMQTIADRLEQTITNSRLYSDLKNALSEEQKARKQLVQNEKLAAMGRLLGSVAHELNNPLQTIKNCLYLVQQEEPAAISIQNYIRMASSETQRLVNLVAELRELYRSHPDKTCNPYDIVTILREVRQLMEIQLFAGNVQWRQSSTPAEFIVRCDKAQIQQVFINLATNAIEAMQPGGGILAIDLTLSPDSHRVGIVFQDTGPGVPADLIGTLFEPFATTKPSGLGLGLSICYEIAQKHGGNITVESQPGKGAAFCFWLPLIVKSC